MKAGLLHALLLMVGSAGAARAADLSLLLMGVSARSFVGPGDIAPNATLFYSASRAYSLATAGTMAANICNQANTSCVDVLSDPITGVVPVPAPDGSVPCDNGAVNQCTVKTVYDQLGSGVDPTQATAANRPKLVIAALGSAVQYMQFTGSSSQLLKSAANTAGANPLTMITYAQRNGALASIGTIMSINNWKMRYVNSAAQVAYGNFTLTGAAATDNAWHSVVGVGNGASSFISVDGVAGGTFTTNTGTSAAAMALGTESLANANDLTGLITEAIVYSAIALTTGQAMAMNANQAAFY